MTARKTVGATRAARVFAVALVSLTSLTASVSQAAAAEADAPPAAVVSLGDSYSSGLGAGGYEDDCDRTDRAWGMIVFGDAVIDRTLLACSGADVPEVAGQVEQLATLSAEAGDRLITVTVGGNDIGFADELLRCLTPLVSCLGREPVIAERIDALHAPLVTLYDAIQAAAPGDEVIVGGYPLLVPDPAVRPRCPALTGLLSVAERQMIRRLGAALNDAIDKAAADAGVRSTAAPLEETFTGHEACANGPNDWLYGVKLTLGDGASPSPTPGDPRWDVIVSLVKESFHPNLGGQGGYADAFEDVWFGR